MIGKLCGPLRQHAGLREGRGKQQLRRCNSPEGLSGRSSQTYLSCRSWCASSPKDPVTAKSPAYHDHPPERPLLKPSDTIVFVGRICRATAEKAAAEVAAGSEATPRQHLSSRFVTLMSGSEY